MGVDVSTAWDQVVAEIAEQFPDFDVQAGEDADRERLKLPAILVDLTELEPEPEGDATTGEWPCRVHFRAQVIYSFRQEKRRRTLARAGGALAAFVHANRFGVVAPEGLAWGGDVFEERIELERGHGGPVFANESGYEC